MSDPKATAYEYYREITRNVIGCPISDFRKSFEDKWTGRLIGGGEAVANYRFDPASRDLRMHSHRPPDGRMGGEVAIVISGCCIDIDEGAENDC